MDRARTSAIGKAGLKSLGLAGAVLLGGLSGAAAAKDGTTDDAIIVEGIKDKAQVIDHYVRALTVVRAGEPLPRYEEGSYCPAVVGLSAERNADLEARMHKVAAAAGVKPAAMPCRTSALVLFVDDKDDFLKAFRKAHPVYFSDPSTRHWSPPREDGPATAWHLTQQLDNKGMPARMVGGVKLFESAAGGSHLMKMTKPVIVMSVVIVERRALVGLTPVQIADYALMRTLTDRVPKNMGETAASTILTAIDSAPESEVAASLTEWDLAYVRGRYTGEAFRNGYSQGAAISAAIKREVTPKEAEDAAE
ncbi:MAG: hypothetical protein JHC57_13705 [Sphingopyxis sp.]|uniref:hypothetical protein n=1 Tax=Sphingopyxis sp. TaxID=1908224 RepID=UPI001A31FBFA|nr:hypothetical protein [Sphingopyxis sp.]MBJ7500801.1 hypothetical protein [Sphingopyxis sp.]